MYRCGLYVCDKKSASMYGQVETLDQKTKCIELPFGACTKYSRKKCKNTKKDTVAKTARYQEECFCLEKK
jgi:hypothetical protein